MPVYAVDINAFCRLKFLFNFENYSNVIGKKTLFS
jgi:hypothetical protein